MRYQSHVHAEILKSQIKVYRDYYLTYIFAAHASKTLLFFKMLNFKCFPGSVLSVAMFTRSFATETFLFLDIFKQLLLAHVQVLKGGILT